MLTPYRVIDLSNERGLLCGQILADLGADVIQVEPPEGNSARRCGPWYKGEPGDERSLFWWAYARNKRSLVLDLKTPHGVAELKKLATGADFWIESERPGDLAKLGLDPEGVYRLTPRELDEMVKARGRLEFAEKCRTRKETAIICTFMSRLSGNKFATFDSVYRNMAIKDTSEERFVRHYRGSFSQQMEKHKAWLKTPEARELQADARNH